MVAGVGGGRVGGGGCEEIQGRDGGAIKRVVRPDRPALGNATIHVTAGPGRAGVPRLRALATTEPATAVT